MVFHSSTITMMHGPIYIRLQSLYGITSYPKRCATIRVTRNVSGYLVTDAVLRTLYTVSETARFYCVTSYVTEKVGKLDSVDTQGSQVSLSVVFHAEKCAFHSGNPTANNSLVFIYYSHTHKNTHRNDKKKKLINLMGNLCCVREHSVQFFVQFFVHS